jgi:phosphatidyl-myo-inositol dimannoside synthase
VLTVPGKRSLLFLTHEYPPYPGGVARYCESVAVAATSLGLRVTVVAPDQNAHTELAVPQADDALEVARFEGNSFDIANLRSLRRDVARIVERQQWDIVHAADWPMILAVDWKSQSAAFKIASLHGSDVIVLKKSWKARLAGASARLKGFDRLVCNSMFTASVLARNFPKAAARDTVVAPLGVDSVWFERPSEIAIEEFKALIKLGVQEKVVLTVARVDERKGHLQTIAALAQLPAALKQNLKYVCIGMCPDAGLVARMQAQASAGGVELLVTGALSSALVRAAYVTATVFALTAEPMEAKIEGFGLVLLEAAAAGLPSVVTAVHAIPEVVTARTGWICPHRDAPAITAAFAEAVGSVRSRAMRDDCIQRAREFTWENCAQLTYL